MAVRQRLERCKAVAVKEILRIGHPILRGSAGRVTQFNTPTLDRLLEDMLDTMAAAHGAGLAAPQIGVPLRVVVFGVETNPRYPAAQPVPLTVLVNPEITITDPAPRHGWEGCLSVPGMRGLVPRPREIRFRGQDAHGEPLEVVADEFHARVVLHECDHLDGILYPQRVPDLRWFGYEAEMAELISRWPEGPPEALGSATD